MRRLIFVSGTIFVSIAVMLVAVWLLFPIPHVAPTWRWSERPWFSSGEPEYRGLRKAWSEPQPDLRGKSLTIFVDVDRNVLCCVSDPIDKSRPLISSDGHSSWVVVRSINHLFVCEEEACLVLIRFGQQDSRQIEFPMRTGFSKSELAPLANPPRQDFKTVDDEEILRLVTSMCDAEHAERIRDTLQ